MHGSLRAPACKACRCVGSQGQPPQQLVAAHACVPCTNHSPALPAASNVVACRVPVALLHSDVDCSGPQTCAWACSHMAEPPTGGARVLTPPPKRTICPTNPAAFLKAQAIADYPAHAHTHSSPQVLLARHQFLHCPPQEKCCACQLWRLHTSPTPRRCAAQHQGPLPCSRARGRSLSPWRSCKLQHGPGVVNQACHKLPSACTLVRRSPGLDVGTCSPRVRMGCKVCFARLAWHGLCVMQPFPAGSCTGA